MRTSRTVPFRVLVAKYPENADAPMCIKFSAGIGVA
jgi:hypothetical protein